MTAKITAFFLKYQKLFFFLLTAACGTFLLLPLIDFQPLLAQGDHGRDLYCFEQTMHGAVPYKDYWWVYGPIMPYYYALFFKWFGVAIPSVLLGKMIINLVSGLLLYLALSSLFTPLIGFWTALWFWTFNADFFYTYCHAGGITCLAATLYFLFLYLKDQKERYLYAGLFAVFVLTLVKINFGFAALGAMLFSILVIDRLNGNPFSKKKNIFYLWAVVLMPLAAIGIYWALLHTLDAFELPQCLPYSKTYRLHNTPLWASALMLWDNTLHNMTFTKTNLLFAAVFILSCVNAGYLVFKKNADIKTRNWVLGAVTILLTMILVNLHEFLISGVFYRSFWIKPFQVAFLFTMIGFAVQNFSKIIRLLFTACVLLVVFNEYAASQNYLGQFKTPEFSLEVERAQTYTSNSPLWTRTVRETVSFLNHTLKQDETFFALPYDTLYYYLTGKTSPTRQLIFFQHNYIPPEQEEKIIKELEHEKVNYILVSSRASTQEEGLGTFGVTHCQVLARYINDHFELAAMFGDWQNEPGWAWNHGTKIFKRVSYRQ